MVEHSAYLLAGEDQLAKKKNIDSNFEDCKEEKKKIVEILVKDLEKRLKSQCQGNKQYIIVPCGNVAQAFLDKINIKSDNCGIRIISDIPHPSRNQWTNEILEKLRDDEDVIKIIEINNKVTQNGKNN